MFYNYLNESEKAEIVQAWELNQMSMAELAKKYGKTRQGIYKILRRRTDTRKQRLPVSCNTCGKEILRPRKQLRDRKHIFCSPECYYAWLAANSDYEEDRYGSRMAREKVTALWPDLTSTMIVHHLDGKQWNNMLPNLVVYRNQGDHVRAHRGFHVEPIWRGEKYWRRSKL